MRSLRMATCTSGDRCRRRGSCRSQSVRSCGLWSAPPCCPPRTRPGTDPAPGTPYVEKSLSRTRSTCYIRTTEGCKSPAPPLTGRANPISSPSGASILIQSSAAAAVSPLRARSPASLLRLERRRRKHRTVSRRSPLRRACVPGVRAARRQRVSTTAGRCRQHAGQRHQRGFRRGTGRPRSRPVARRRRGCHRRSGCGAGREVRAGARAARRGRARATRT